MALSIALWWHPLLSTLHAALASAEYTHILLVVPLSLALIYQERRNLPQNFAPSVSWGSACLVTALLANGVARVAATGWADDVRLFSSMFGLVTWWIGCVLLCFGMPVFRALRFPLCFLFGIVPLPVFVLDELIYALQQASALVTRLLFVAAGVPVTQDGTLLSLPAMDVEVARQCSSIRSSTLLMITGMVFAHLFLHSRWRKWLLIAATVPLAAIKNGLRIFTIVELGTEVDPVFFDSALHHRGGILFLGIAMAVVAAMVWVLRRGERPELQRLKLASLI